MAIDFPASPTPGQVYQGYYWDDDKNAWRSQSTNRGSVITSATTPTGATAGDLWFNTVDGTMYVYYNDGITTQWVEIQANVDNYKTPSQNYIINGAFDIWQRGTNFNLSGLGFQYTADRWVVRYPGSGTSTVTRQEFTPGTAPVAGYEGQYFLRASSTFDVLEIMQRLEDVRTFAGQTITISFWVKSASAQNITIQTEQNFGTGGSSPLTNFISGTIPVTTSWTRVSKTFNVASVSGKTIGANSYFAIGTRSASNNAIDIWGFQVELGTIATPFRRNQPNIQAELAACQRYYSRIVTTPYSAIGSGLSQTATRSLVYIKLPTTMRVPPTSIGYSNLIITDRTAYDLSVTSSTDLKANADSVYWCMDHNSGATQYRPALLTGHPSLTGYFEANAEL